MSVADRIELCQFSALSSQEFITLDSHRHDSSTFSYLSYNFLRAPDSYERRLYLLLVGNLMASMHVHQAPSQAKLSNVEKRKSRKGTIAVVLTEMCLSTRLKTGGKNSDDTSGGSC